MGITTGFITGRVDVISSEWKRLSYDSALVADTSILIRCDHRNKGNIWISGTPDAEVSGTDGALSAFPLFPGDACTLDYRKPFELWVRGDTDQTNYLWWIAT